MLPAPPFSARNGRRPVCDGRFGNRPDDTRGRAPRVSRLPCTASTSIARRRGVGGDRARHSSVRRTGGPRQRNHRGRRTCACRRPRGVRSARRPRPPAPIDLRFAGRMVPRLGSSARAVARRRRGADGGDPPATLCLRRVAPLGRFRRHPRRGDAGALWRQPADPLARLRIPNNAVDATFDEILAALRDAKARADGDTAAT